MFDLSSFPAHVAVTGKISAERKKGALCRSNPACRVMTCLPMRARHILMERAGIVAARFWLIVPSALPRNTLLTTQAYPRAVVVPRSVLAGQLGPVRVKPGLSNSGQFSVRTTPDSCRKCCICEIVSGVPKCLAQPRVARRLSAGQLRQPASALLCHRP